MRLLTWLITNAIAGIVKAIAEAAGKEPKIVLYDPAAVDIEKGKGFHFRCDSAACSHKHCFAYRPKTTAMIMPCITLPLVCLHFAGAVCYRTNHFFASADKAKRALGWYPEHNFLMDVGELVERYKASGRLEKEIDFSVDDKILASVGQ